MIAATGNAMPVLVSHADTATLGDFIDAGATHFLTSPHGEGELLQALRCAERHAERVAGNRADVVRAAPLGWHAQPRSEEHTSELQSLMRISYAVFCLNKKKNKKIYKHATAVHRKT